ncbi:MAG: MarR family winged helix-turn-helix transcriptional regulator [Acidimicrobiia bacterium]
MTRDQLSDLYPDDLVASTAALLQASMALFAAFDRAAVGPLGLDAATADLLVRLAKAPDNSLRGVDVAAQLRIGPTRVSRLVDRGEEAGLVQRTPDPNDRRAQRIVLTDAGVDVAVAYAPLMRSVIDQVATDTFTAKERDQLVALLRRLRDAADDVEAIDAVD